MHILCHVIRPCLPSRPIASRSRGTSSAAINVRCAASQRSASSAAMQPVPADGDRLAVVVVGHVAGGEHARDAGVGAERHRSSTMYFLSVSSQLPFEKRGVRRVADRQEHAGGVQLLRAGRRPCSSARRRSRPSASVPSTSSTRVVPDDFDLRVGLGPFGHDLRGPQLVAAMDQVARGWRTWSDSVASSTAESPPPTTTSGLLRKRGSAPSHTAQALTPRFLNASSEGSPR